MSAAASATSSRSAPRLQARPAAATPAAASSSRPVAARPAAPRPTVSRVASTASSSKPTPAASSSKSSKAPLPSATPSTSTPTFLVAGKDTSSSTGKVFAKPSKEWVLPERAKPGRKVAVEEPDSTRQSQNRQSQRAHRARRTDYISTLEERIRQFENDEIHSNVRLQEVARALKADNERLKAELLARPAKDGSATPKGWADEREMLLSEIRTLREEVGTLRMKKGALGLMRINDRSGSMSVTPHPSSPLISPTPPINGIRHTAECPICPDPDPDCPCQKTAVSAGQPGRNRIIPRFSSHSHQPDPTIPLGSTIHLLHSPTLPTTSCGFCQSTEECLCRMIDEEEDVKPIILTPHNDNIPLDDGCGLCADGGFCACAVARNSPSVLNHTSSESPAKSAAIPLRKLRSSGRVPTRKSIWALESGVVSATSNIESSRSAEAVCSGDPKNCDACRNDTFEFCSNFFSSRDPSHSCTNCAGKCSSATAGPSTQPPIPKYWSQPTHIPSPAPSADLHPFDSTSSSGPLLMACCGNPSLCGQQSGGCSGDVIGIGGLIPGLPEKDIAHETIRVDQAWKTLKAHPNAKFASLAFLADIVAQRSGPHIAQGTSTSALPGSPVSVAGGASPSSKPVSDVTGQRALLPSKLGLVQAASGMRDDASEVDIKGKRKMVVDSSAVRDALRLLDGTPAPSDDGEDTREYKRPRMD